MAKGKSVFHRFALKQKIALARKTKVVKTLQNELNRAENVRDQLAEIADGMAVPVGETTIRQIRSNSWYGNQVHDQLKTISNRAEFLSQEVLSHQRDAAMARHRHSLALERSEDEERDRRAAIQAKADAVMPPRRSG